MKIIKILNNNAVGSVDENEQEIILLGKGIGFNKRVGDTINQDTIEQVFFSPTHKKAQYEKLVSEIPYKILGYADTIISKASKRLGKRLNDSVYITLSDHLNYAIERAREGIDIKNTLLWEIQRYYKEEYQLGLEAIEYLYEQEQIELSNDEAGFIALHLVNAEMEDMEANRSLEIAVMVKDILNIVRYSCNVTYDEKSVSYDRFVRHIKFFVQRSLSNQLENKENPNFYHDFNEKYPNEYRVSQTIQKYVESRTNITILEEELMYLTLHILIITRQKP